MEEAKKTMDRRQFTTLAAALAALSGVAITISSCGGGGSSPTSSSGTGGSTGGGGAVAATDKTGTISNNHGHSAVITAAQLTAGGALDLDIQGTSSHTHAVQLSSTEISSVASGLRVSKDSSNNNGHTHTVTFN
jgi:hypothetical protein